MMKHLAKLYLLFTLLLAVFLGWQLTLPGRIQTDLTALLPAETGIDAVWRAADAANEKQLNGQILLLVGADEPDKAFQAAEQVAQRWRNSGLFAQVDGSIAPDIGQIRTDTQMLALAALPAEQVRLLNESPQQYFRQRAEDAANPFAAGVLGLEQDWLGFGRFVLHKQSGSALQWQPENGMLYTEKDGKTWVWLRAKLPEKQGTDAEALLGLLAQSRAEAAQGGYELLAAGGALFAAETKTATERESTLMSAAGTLLTFALLLWVFRSGRVLALFVPLAVGVLTGLAAAMAVFGHIHILTIVIGTSLVGVLVDFPLHWLAPALFARQKQPENGGHGEQGGYGWRPHTAMHHVLPTFCISLAVTVSGYVLLWFTPLPVLRQTAVFSAAALLGAFAATVLWLPALFARYRAKPVPFARLMDKLADRFAPSFRQPEKTGFVWWLPVALLVYGIAAKAVWHDDIRSWSNLSPDLLAQTKKISDISGMNSSGRFLLVWADTPDKLLQKSRAVADTLEPSRPAAADADTRAGEVQALHQWVLPEAEQAALKQRLRELAGQPESYAPLVEAGIPAETVQSALKQAADSPNIPLESSLKPALAEAWRNLYLGRVEGKYAALIRLGNRHGYNEQYLSALLDQPECDAAGCVRFADKRVHLNAQFSATRTQAALLKLGSFVLAWLVLWRVFGARHGSLILAVPLTAAAASVGVLGWLGIPVGLFAMFGLLLTAAIGVDYAVYALTARESAAARIGGITLAALTTAISFALLAFSSTPAVAAFGVTVAAGCVFNWLLSVRLAARRKIPAV